MLTVADIKKDLPDWPDAVDDDWLIYFANKPDLKWPPPEPLGNHRWSGILGGRPLSWWKNVTWKKEKVNCGLDSFCPKSRNLTVATHSDVHEGRADEDEKRRYKMPMQYILESSEVIAPRASLEYIAAWHRHAFSSPSARKPMPSLIWPKIVVHDSKYVVRAKDVATDLLIGVGHQEIFV
jgi:hypothetical protein